MIVKSILALITAMFTGITLRTPSSAWITVGVTGMLGWATNQVLSGWKLPELIAAATSALVVGTAAEILARIQKQPVTVYVVSGIIPLVPGTIAYNSMLAFIEKRFDQGLFLAFRSFLIASYLAAGLAIAPLVIRYFRLVFKKREHK